MRSAGRCQIGLNFRQSAGDAQPSGRFGGFVERAPRKAFDPGLRGMSRQGLTNHFGLVRPGFEQAVI